MRRRMVLCAQGREPDVSGLIYRVARASSSMDKTPRLPVALSRLACVPVCLEMQTVSLDASKSSRSGPSQVEKTYC